MSLDRGNMIDAVGIDETSGRTVLILRHEEEWDGSDKLLFALQEKLNAYLSFALDGEMEETCPQYAGRPLKLRIETPHAPDERTLEFLTAVKRQISFQDIQMEIKLGGGELGGCRCGEHEHEAGGCGGHEHADGVCGGH